MTMPARSLCAMVFLMGIYSAPALADDAPGVEAKAAFEKLKTLDGEWKSDASDKAHGGKTLYKVTANGTTLMETLMPGTQHEMVSMYFLDGDDLRMTHYCAAGNQPKLKLDKKASKPGDFVFVFDGGTNLNADKDTHIHGMKMTFKDKDHVEANWEGYQDGKSSGVMKFTMVRP